MPTRYTLDVDLKNLVTPEALESATKKVEARKVRWRRGPRGNAFCCCLVADAALHCSGCRTSMHIGAPFALHDDTRMRGGGRVVVVFCAWGGVWPPEKGWYSTAHYASRFFAIVM